MAPDSFSAASCSQSIPSSSRTSSVCWPVLGAGRERRRALVELHRARHQRERRRRRRVDLRQVAVGDRLRIVAHLARALHRRPHALDGVERSRHSASVCAANTSSSSATHSSRFSKRAMPLSKRGSAIMSAPAEVPAEVGPEPVGLQHVQEEPAAVLRPVAVDDRVRRLVRLKPGISCRCRRSSSLLETMSGRQDPHGRAEQRDVDDRRLAGALAAEERRRRCPPAMVMAAGRVAEGGALHDGRVGAGGRERVGDAAARPERRGVVAALLGVGPARALAVAAHVDDLGVDGRMSSTSIRSLPPRRRQEVGEEDVGVLDQRRRATSRPSSVAEVDADAALARGSTAPS